MKKSDREWLAMLLSDPKLNRNWREEQERIKREQALALDDIEEENADDE